MLSTGYLITKAAITGSGRRRRTEEALVPAPFFEQLLHSVLCGPAQIRLDGSQESNRDSPFAGIGHALPADEQWLQGVDPYAAVGSR